MFRQLVRARRAGRHRRRGYFCQQSGHRNDLGWFDAGEWVFVHNSDSFGVRYDGYVVLTVDYSARPATRLGRLGLEAKSSPIAPLSKGAHEDTIGPAAQ